MAEKSTALSLASHSSFTPPATASLMMPCNIVRIIIINKPPTLKNFCFFLPVAM